MSGRLDGCSDAANAWNWLKSAKLGCWGICCGEVVVRTAPPAGTPSASTRCPVSGTDDCKRTGQEMDQWRLLWHYQEVKPVFGRLAPLPVWAAVEAAPQEETLSQTAAVGLVPLWQRRCDSCPKTTSESGTAGGEEEEGAGLRPSAPLETHLTETWTQTVHLMDDWIKYLHFIFQLAIIQTETRNKALLEVFKWY